MKQPATRLGHLRHHLLAYWHSVRGPKTAGADAPNFGAWLRCPVFVINLERSPYRREYMTRYLAAHGLEARIATAVDGVTLDIANLPRGVYDDTLAREKFSRSLSRTEIACALSHLNVYRTIVDENIPMALVLEDDAVFAPGTEQKLRQALAEAPDNWDILQLSHDCSEYTPLTENLVAFPSTTRLPVGAAGYFITKRGAEKMLANGFPIRYPADSLLGRCPRWGVVLYGLAPSVIRQNAIFPTQIYVQPTTSIRLKQLVKGGVVSIAGRIARNFNGAR